MADLVDLAFDTVTRLAPNDRQTRTYTVLANDKVFTITAGSAQDRILQMSEMGIDLVRDDWAAGYRSPSGAVETCGNSPALVNELKRKLRR